MIYVGIIIVLAVILVNLLNKGQYRLISKVKEITVFKSLNKARFALSVNYNSSSILKYKLKKLIALSVTIVNRVGYDLNDVNITVMPAHKMIDYDDITIQDEKQKRTDRSSPLEFIPLNSGAFSVEAGQMLSGYLLFEALSDTCDIDKLLINHGNETEEIILRKGKVINETSVRFVSNRT